MKGIAAGARVGFFWLLLGLLGCSGAAPRDEAAGTAVRPAPAAERPERRVSRSQPRGSLPVLRGRTLEGHPVSTESLVGRRLVVFLFRPEASEAAALAPALAALVPRRAIQNFELLGVSVGATREAARRFASAQGLAFPILDDAEGRLARQLRLASPAAVIAADASGAVVLARARFTGSEEGGAESLAAALDHALRLSPARPADAAQDLLARPAAPDFEATSIHDGSRLRLSEFHGRPLLLVFFLHHCPYCHAAFRTLDAELAALPEARRPALLGVETSTDPTAIRPALDEAGIAELPVVHDGDHRIRDAYGVFGDVPVVVMIDARGRIAYRTKPGWDAARDPDIVASWLARVAEVPVPMRLQRHGYTGNEVCGACHSLEYATWELTPHGRAFDTLVTHGAERDADCVGCHVVGFGEAGGFTMEQSHGATASDFEGVGCEACHGRGGPHLSPEFVPATGYATVCQGCHDAKHSLGFDYARLRSRVSHSAIAGLSSQERAELFGEGARRDVLPAHGSFVGSEACASCHPAEHTTWSASGHARAFESLERSAHGRDAECLPCHTTGLGRRGGFEAGAEPAAQADLARVGCESCHGPGGDHVAPGARRRGTILALEDKCDSCVILQICGTCHDDENDPGFAFEVQARIELQRHGAPRSAPGALERN